ASNGGVLVHCSILPRISTGYRCPWVLWNRTTVEPFTRRALQRACLACDLDELDQFDRLNQERSRRLARVNHPRAVVGAVAVETDVRALVVKSHKHVTELVVPRQHPRSGKNACNLVVVHCSTLPVCVGYCQ